MLSSLCRLGLFPVSRARAGQMELWPHLNIGLTISPPQTPPRDVTPSPRFSRTLSSIRDGFISPHSTTSSVVANISSPWISLPDKPPPAIIFGPPHAPRHHQPSKETHPKELVNHATDHLKFRLAPFKRARSRLLCWNNRGL